MPRRIPVKPPLFHQIGKRFSIPNISEFRTITYDLEQRKPGTRRRRIFYLLGAYLRFNLININFSSVFLRACCSCCCPLALTFEGKLTRSQMALKLKILLYEMHHQKNILPQRAIFFPCLSQGAPDGVGASDCVYYIVHMRCQFRL